MPSAHPIAARPARLPTPPREVDAARTALPCLFWMRELQEQVALLGPTEAAVLVTGETGSGKDLVARAIHLVSRRARGPFVAVNCAAFPHELVESELFGHEPGAFTGAARQHIGKFERAVGGTLFLDEIGHMSLPAQAKLLRAIEEKVIERVGGNARIPVDVRILGATNRDPLAEIDAGRLLHDLYHRLAEEVLHVRPLRERRNEIEPLTEHFLAELAAEDGVPPAVLQPEAAVRLADPRLPWRGNIRQLRNVVGRVWRRRAHPDRVTAADVEAVFRLPDLATASPDAEAGAAADPDPRRDWAPPADWDPRRAPPERRRQVIQAALRATRGHRGRAADLLGRSREWLRQQLQALG